MNILKKLKKRDPFYFYLFGKKNENIFILILNVTPAILAGLMEGISYGALLLGVNVLRGEPAQSVPFVGFLLKYIQNMSVNRQFLTYLTIALGIQLIRSFFLFLSYYITSQLALKIAVKMQITIYKQIFNFSYPFVSKYQSGELLSYNNTPMIIPALLTQVNSAITSLILSFMSLFCLLKINIVLTAVLICIFILVNFLYKYLLKRLTELSVSFSKDEVRFTSQTNQHINGIKLIHMFYRNDFIINRSKDVLHTMTSYNSKMNFWKTLIFSTGEVFSILVVGLMLFVGAILLHHKTAYVSFLLMFIVIAYRLASKLQSFIANLGEIVSYKGSLMRLKKILKEDDKEYFSAKGKKIQKFNKAMIFKNVSFNYLQRKTCALKDFSYTFEKGKTYAIVGRSGAGKSTLIDLILRLYSPQKGSILVDDEDLEHLSLQSWRNKIGIVNQDIFLFHDDIEINIKFGKENATRKEVIESTKISYAHDFISKLPDKYKTIVGEKGQKLSGGERQRIALARALIKKPEILILDEATNQLDSFSERLIQQAIDNLKGEKTFIIIAHRLSTIVNADAILVINNGMLIEQGSHEELLKARGSYYDLWVTQNKKNDIFNKNDLFKATEFSLN